ncbi:MAG: hypothetical protein UV38_C0004G0012 [candidate division TM6 bacterium GW2011_GWE2_42_60]|nr:MAG: hypothetical protein UV38_C0004G0012 [candidate division TM6 bacterium GW2011_GWE2_42_60]HBY05890.1 hypothetical protein [Candidatus Dependentiae bacterium]
MLRYFFEKIVDRSYPVSGEEQFESKPVCGNALTPPAHGECFCVSKNVSNHRDERGSLQGERQSENLSIDTTAHTECFPQENMSP